MLFETDFSRTKREGYLLGERETLDKVEAMFSQAGASGFAQCAAAPPTPC